LAASPFRGELEVDRLVVERATGMKKLNRTNARAALWITLLGFALLWGCRRAPEPGREWVAQAEEGVWLLDIGEIFEGARQIDEAVAEIERLYPQSLNHGRVLISSCRKLWYQQEADEAVATCERALEIVQRVAPDGPEHAEIFDLFGLAALRFDHLDSAEEYFRDAFEIRKSFSDDERDLVSSYEKIGMLALARGDLLESERRLRRAVSLLEAEPEETLQLAALYHGLGQIARKRYQRDLSEDFHERALRIRSRLAPGSPKHASSLRNLGGILLDRGGLTPEGLEQVRSYYQQTIEVWDSHEGHFESPIPLAAAIVGLGKVSAAEGDLETAIGHFESARQLAEENPTLGRTRHVAILSRLGDAYIRAGKREKAREALETGLALTEIAGRGGYHHIRILRYLGRFAREDGQHGLALGYYNRALRLVDDDLSRLGGGEETLGRLLTKYHPIYLGAMVSQINLGRPELALDIVERYRARSFLARITERDFLATAGVVPHLEARQSEIAESYDRIQIQLGNDLLSDERRFELVEQEDQLRVEQRELAEAVRRASPRLAAVRYPEPMRAREVQELLEDGTLMLSYFVVDRRVVAFSVTQDDVDIVEIPIGESALLQLLTRFRRSILEDPSADAVELGDLSTELYDLLIEPFEEEISQGSRLLIVPDGPLNLLPFGALRSRGGEFLIEQTPLHVALSATVYGQLVESGGAAKRREAASADSGRLRFAGFADPVVGRQATSYAASRGGVGRGADARGGAQLDPLPESVGEVRRIAALYSSRSEVYTGTAATENQVKEVLPRSDVLHFATHGIVDEVHPLDSALVFSVADGETSNGLLQAWEVYQTRNVDADLVVLSACRSGLGSVAGGEGLIGLTRAFQYAGAQSVVASLWDVADRSTAELMVRFYEYLHQGHPKVDALRLAQLDLLNGDLVIPSESGGVEDYSSPYFWAAFQLYGDGR